MQRFILSKGLLTMNKKNRVLNTRILIIDDEEAVRENFCTILKTPDNDRHNTLRDAAALLFDDDEIPASTHVPQSRWNFTIDTAENGKRGFELVQMSLAECRPYAIIFCDMRMPIWDGIETIQHIRTIDSRVGIIVITAYSDYDIANIVRAAGADVGYFIKPFSRDEVLQMATRGVIEWNKAQELESLIRIMSTISGQDNDVQTLLTHLLDQICAWLGTDSAAFLTKCIHGDHYEFKFGVGRLQNAEAASDILKRLACRPINDVYIDNDLVMIPMYNFGCTVGLLGNVLLTPDRIFLLKLFAEHAHNALRNSEMQTKLLETERMSAIGNAVSFIAHDLRSSISAATQLINMLEINDESVCSQDKLFEIIKNTLDTAFNLADDIVGYAKKAITIEPQDIDIHDLLVDIVTVWRLQTDYPVDIDLDIDAVCKCHIDRNRFQRVLNNLIKNACEAAAMHPKQKGHVLIQARNREKALVLSIQDNGTGIAEEVKAKLFQPFATVGKVHGSGFGLAVVKQIIDAHGATIKVDSNSEGTIFTIELPVP